MQAGAAFKCSPSCQAISQCKIKEEDIGCLKDEVEDFKLQVFDDNLLQKDPYVFWNSISKLEDPVCGDLRYSLLFRIAKALLILPNGNADTERVFSKLNLIKTKLRNCIGNKSMNALLTLDCNNSVPCCVFNTPPDVICLVKNAMHYN